MSNEQQQQQADSGIEAELLKMAQAVDAGELNPDEATAIEPPESAAGDAEKPTETADKEAAESKEKAEPEVDPGTKPEETESQYSKARKEQERREKSWQKLNEEKEAFRREREEFEKKRQEAEQQQTKAAGKKDEAGYTAADYEKFAEETDDPDLARKAILKAQNLRKQETTEIQQHDQQKFAETWQKNLTEVIAANKELEDQNSELGKALTAVLKEVPAFSLHPDGIKHAVEYAKAKSQSGLVPGLNEKVKQLETQIADLTKKLTPGGGGPNQRSGAKSFDAMSTEEQFAELQRQAQEVDRAA